jgi:hypothetical protein
MYDWIVSGVMFASCIAFSYRSSPASSSCIVHAFSLKTGSSLFSAHVVSVITYPSGSPSGGILNPDSPPIGSDQARRSCIGVGVQALFSALTPGPAPRGRLGASWTSDRDCRQLARSDAAERTGKQIARRLDRLLELVPDLVGQVVEELLRDLFRTVMAWVAD